jgi:putative adhesin
MPATALTSLRRLTAAILLMTAALAVSAGCNLHIGTGIEARESWTKSYTVKPGATLAVRESNGKIRVTAGDGDKIEVTATRISKASTEEAAKADLKEFSIAETATPEMVEFDSSNRSLQMTLHGTRRVEYEIKVPKGVNVTLKTANAAIDVQGVTGQLTVETTNGDIEAIGLGGGADVTAVNGRVRLELAKVHDAGVRCKTTNGQIIVTLPAGAKATLAARVLHGDIQTENLSLKMNEESRQRLDATMGGGGPEIRLETTNGEVRVVGK